ncbi:MAG: hypothetical protein IPJ65_26305 [Archangiaceae bacterium]|nr:hypothetical protein [Archangiaceae bacterium]
MARVGDSTFMVGEHGTVYRDGVKAPALTDATLFGVWGASSRDECGRWGPPLGNGDNDVLLRFDGASWAKVPSPEPLGWRTSRSGERATTSGWWGSRARRFHYDGSAWSRVTTGVRSTLLTVTGRSRSDVWAVGGPPAVLARFDGTGWKNEELPFEASGLTGIAMGPDDEVVVVGLAGVRWRRVGGSWVDDSDQPALGDLHATWVPSQGDAWAVGGNYIAVDAQTVRKGIVAHYGGGAVSAP